MWMTYEHVIRNAAGLGKVADDHNDPDRYEKTNAHCDVLIAGGGAAGLMAALQAGRSGARVILADEQNEFGGWLLGEADVTIDGAAPAVVSRAPAGGLTNACRWELHQRVHGGALGLRDLRARGFVSSIDIPP